ncbi:hypothetical protein [Nevskia sp.]|uniref:hypothetical protein n=1 Tax=Nevskia sp. TaxID=1929292 RepID=UPI0025F73BBB|nr:hypothetical protein [Nevskia sp.]
MRRGRALLLLGLLTLAVVLWWLIAERASAPVPAPPIVAESTPAAAEAAEPAKAAVPAAPRQTVEKAVVESGIPVRLVRRVRIKPPAGRLADGYAALLPEAMSGNRVSQYRLGLLLYECREVPVDQAGLDRDVEAIHQTRRRSGWEVSAPKAEEATLRHLYAQCDGIPQDARTGFRDWLKQAADAGVIEAQINLPLKIPPDDYCQFLAECSPEQRAKQEALQAEAIDYVGRAREAGSVAALWTFAAWYAEGEVLPQNDIEAYAHFRALDQINAAAKQTPRFDKLLAGMRQRLRPVDVDAGEARSRELLSNPNCCVITP